MPKCSPEETAILRSVKINLDYACRILETIIREEGDGPKEEPGTDSALALIEANRLKTAATKILESGGEEGASGIDVASITTGVERLRSAVYGTLIEEMASGYVVCIENTACPIVFTVSREIPRTLGYLDEAEEDDEINCTFQVVKEGKAVTMTLRASCQQIPHALLIDTGTLTIHGVTMAAFSTLEKAQEWSQSRTGKRARKRPNREDDEMDLGPPQHIFYDWR